MGERQTETETDRQRQTQRQRQHIYRFVKLTLHLLPPDANLELVVSKDDQQHIATCVASTTIFLIASVGSGIGDDVV